MPWIHQEIKKKEGGEEGVANLMEYWDYVGEVRFMEEKEILRWKDLKY